MDTPSARLLRLLVLLQSRTRWTGPELRTRLGVSARTLRYDVGKLRGLGYPVHAVPGVGGGYVLRPGTVLPPLQLEDDEAVAMAIGLRAATGVAGVGDAAATALAKLEQVMPTRLRGRVAAVRGFTASAGGSGPPTDPDTVVFLTGACRDRRRVRFGYTPREGPATRREVEPYRLVHMGHRWYLHAFDPSRDDWRMFRLDRMAVERPEGGRFVARQAPSPASLLAAADAHHLRHTAVVLVDAPAETIVRLVPAQVLVEPAGDHRCRVHATGESPHGVVLHVVMLDRPFLLEEGSPAVRDAFRVLGGRLAAAGLGSSVAAR